VAPKTAASILFRNEMASATSDKENEALFQRYYEKYVYAYRAASLRHINDIIEPRETRRVLVQSLKIVRGKEQVRPNKKHGNIPL
jgi:propionyl-CoA carboxylase beta chain